MIDATLIETEDFRSINKIKSYKFTVPEVLAGTTSDIVRFDLEKKEYKLLNFRISCDSLDYNVSFKSGALALDYSVDEMLVVEEILKQYNDQKLDVIISNSDDPETTFSYLTLINNDLINSTGIVDIVFVISEM